MKDVPPRGSLCKLSSGGPKMTVGASFTHADTHATLVECSWFVDGIINRDMFDLRDLSPWIDERREMK